MFRHMYVLRVDIDGNCKILNVLMPHRQRDFDKIQKALSCI